MYLGEPTGSAMPLMWAHAEYIKLLRSVQDGKVYDLVPLVAERYLEKGLPKQSREVWKFNRQVRTIKPQQVLRVQAGAAFRLRWSVDSWQTVEDTNAQFLPLLDLGYVDIPVGLQQAKTISFTFFWPNGDGEASGEKGRWEQHNYTVEVAP